MPPPRPRPAPHTTPQPRTYSVGFKAVLSFPFRLCNPPPAVGKVRSCGVTPLIKVRLEDVLNRQHLPPLGLKDFEDWLLFVEMSPENLYFILWLREYKLRYMQWQSQASFAPCVDLPLEDSSRLAMFYARAKQTFFTPGSAYELNLSSTLLAPFHCPNASPHPSPDAFREVELETYSTLDESLRRFVHAQLNNVGNRRVLCGIIAGIVFCLIGAITPLAVLFATHAPRWARLAVFPGLWVGLAVLVASLNGICLGVYIFGDLRQLRKFELARPPISKPQTLPAYRPIVQSANAQVLAKHAERAPSVSSLATRDTAFSAAGSDETDGNIHISPAYYADSVDGIDPLELYAPNPSSAEDLGMHYYDEHAGKHNDSAVDLGEQSISALPRIVQPSSSSTSPTLDPIFSLPHLTGSSSAGSPTPSTTSTRYTATATFIHPFDITSPAGVDEEEVLARAVKLPARHQLVAPFDFEGLPVHPGHRARNARSFGPHAHTPLLPVQPGFLHPHHNYHSHSQPALPRPPEPTRATAPRGLRGLLGRMQERCGVAPWRLQIGYLEDRGIGREGESPAPHHSSPYWSQTRGMSLGIVRSSSESEKTHGGDARTLSEKDGDYPSSKGKERTFWKRLRAMRSVPAFAVPLARVLSPVVVRGQWEIVVRSMVVAFVMAVTLVAALLAVPVT